MSWQVLEGDCVEVMRSMDEASVDAIVTDPPYFLGFMNKAWDTVTPRQMQATHEAWAREALRVLKPGGHMLAFSGTRTYHRLACAVEDAGLEIRDTIQWVYGSGFPKSLNVGKAIDKVAGVERQLVDRVRPDGKGTGTAGGWKQTSPSGVGKQYSNLAATDKAKRWDGWGSALKPAHEPIVLARKPLQESSIARQVLSTGTGALNISATRVGGNVEEMRGRSGVAAESNRIYGEGVRNPDDGAWEPVSSGRFPANLIFSHHPDCVRVGERRVKGNGAFPQRIKSDSPIPFRSDEERTERIEMADDSGMETIEAYECVDSCPVGELDRQSGTSKSPKPYEYQGKKSGGFTNGDIGQGFNHNREFGDSGGASRFFYVAKASRRERNAGLEGMPEEFMATMNSGIGKREHSTDEPRAYTQNTHPTVKPIALMRYLCRLITPPGGTVLDPFAGSGSTGCACVLEGFDFIGVERESEYAEIARRRIAHHAKVPESFAGAGKEDELTLPLEA